MTDVWCGCVVLGCVTDVWCGYVVLGCMRDVWCGCVVLECGVVSSVMDARSLWEARYVMKERKTNKTTFQGRVYNFLERPTGWKCFLYHFSV
ncbi:hypothetical protein Pcinc_033539 [Petrolisthes cinctipes]|uniref:Potassium voltage-gated channel subfamily KQT member 1 n=1 Tax=Petrolisthes cinctipes TaxID=88211 RepID=A0AAE1JZ33_PETCI|nr:hypothetical protein Pcinc_033539 [Petrolisthes cinctipes]